MKYVTFIPRVILALVLILLCAVGISALAPFSVGAASMQAGLINLGSWWADLAGLSRNIWKSLV